MKILIIFNRIVYSMIRLLEILRRVNLDTLNVRRDSICHKYFVKIKVGTRILNDLLPDKRHTEYNIRQENVYQILERIDSVTPLYRGIYTTVNKKDLNTVIFAVSNVFFYCICMMF